jgi:hypothetical protein
VEGAFSMTVSALMKTFPPHVALFLFRKKTDAFRVNKRAMTPSTNRMAITMPAMAPLDKLLEDAPLVDPPAAAEVVSGEGWVVGREVGLEGEGWEEGVVFAPAGGVVTT